jgi:hypothetical protein
VTAIHTDTLAFTAARFSPSVPLGPPPSLSQRQGAQDPSAGMLSASHHALVASVILRPARLRV